MPSTNLILLTGATGYVGGRLLKLLENEGRRVRCLARRPERLRARVAAATEIVPGDVLDARSLEQALSGVHTAYYLVHSMDAGDGFEEIERRGAECFGAAARSHGVRRIVYLGGLGDSSERLSAHLRSRHAVGDVLRRSGVPVIEFRASIIIGSGSLSFEMIRALVERLPVMITPRWVAVQCQPIAISDLLAHLRAALTAPVEGGAIFEIGGPDRVTYGQLMREYARERGLRRLMIAVPVLTPRLSSLWLRLVTPFHARVGRKLIDSIRHPTVVRDDAAQRVFGIRCCGARDAIAAALRDEDREFAETRWSDVVSTPGARFGARLFDSRRVRVGAPPASAFLPIRRIGGRTGWYYGDWLWRLRGWLDVLAGGVGMRRGRADPEELAVGDAIDGWRVAAFEPDRRLLLETETKLPGRAWLEFSVDGDAQGSTITQTAVFDPLGLVGLIYWLLVYPVHRLVFGGMLRAIARAVSRPTAAVHR